MDSSIPSNPTLKPLKKEEHHDRHEAIHERGQHARVRPHLGNQRSVSRAGPFQLRRGTGNRTTAESPLAQTVENEKGGYAVKRLDLNEPIAPDLIDFFDKVPLANIPQAIDSLFVLSKEDSYACLAATVLYASGYYAQAVDGRISVKKICDIVQLFFAKSLGDENEYSSRLDEIIEVHLTGVHVVGGSHKQIAKPNSNGCLANLWNPVRNAFMDRHTTACVSARLADILRPYRNGCMLGESNNLLSLKEGNAALVVTVPDYDRTNDKLFFAVMDKLFTSLYARNREVVPQKNAPLRVIAEECDAKPSIWLLGSIAKSAARNNIRLNLHYSSVAAFRRKHSDYANEILEAFDSIAFLDPNEPAALQEIQLRTGLSAQEIRRTALDGGWLFQRGKKPQRIDTISNQEAA